MNATLQPAWETELSDYLAELTNVQAELLIVLKEKRARMAACDLPGLEETQPRAEELAQRLQACQQRRQELLHRAAAEGLPATSLQQLAGTLKQDKNPDLANQVKNAAASCDLLRHQTLTNWIFAQRSLLHVAEMLEIIATGGRLQPTYGYSDAIHSTGSLLNHQA